jgi:hypothetical protein
MKGEQPSIYEQGNLTFYVYSRKIVVVTPHQAFYLEPSRHYWNRRVQLIMRMIELNEIRNLNELASWTNPGINWVATSKKNHLALDLALA